jgi:hypothetical protein
MGAVNIVDKNGHNLPFFIDFYERYSIVTEDFSPIQDPSLSASEIGVYTKNGFLVRPSADGDLYGITWYAYNKNNNSLAGLVPKPFDGLANQWIECPFVKVYRGNVGQYRSVAPQITVGVLV